MPHETPTIIYEHPVTMDIPVTGSWVATWTAWTTPPSSPRLRATFKRRITPMALL
ncbi:MAG: hypothetical protein ACLT38_03235 [Akkermansia sp.]